MKKKYLSYDEAKFKIQQFCAYQERCQSEVRTKLIEYGIYGDELENLIADLISDNFLNEERFAKAFAGGKFRIKQWGKRKIIEELKFKKISDYSIRKAMSSEISDEDYRQTLLEVLNKKSKLLSEIDNFKKNQKLASYAMGRGFETELVWECLNNLFKD